ncbi:O-antigen ligase family protein [Leucobacter komagatae]|uniref:Exopolysaccharide production protein n=1 Tax=Leucobacter komagatae TaxID=55969 RepID=A0A0D0H3W7_9MICO|nr:O-antigen ligase family protein [Leucobacter komagatae]KIP51865.1 exopolysaccharide production protein [Leucobacter komagatae]
MANSKTRLGVSAYAIVVFVFALGSNGVRNLIDWPGFIIAAVALAVIGAVMFLRLRPERFRWYRLPAPIYLFLALAALSIIWSQYTLESVLGTIAQLLTTFVAVALAFVLTWHEVLRTLGTALRYLIGLSLLFELWVSVFIREPILPPWLELTAAQEANTPKLLYWSRDLLFEGGPIQGLVASSTLFGFIGLIGLIVFAIQLRAKLITRFAGWFWVLLAVATLALTRSATVTVALAAVIVALAFALWARRVGPEGRLPVYITGAVLLAGMTAALLFARSAIFGLLGKSSDLTGRGETWEGVIQLAQQRPWFGWGWISYWAPWAEPFASLDTQGGIQVMSAHNAWLDVWLQLGIVGLFLFFLLVALTLWRVWFRAVDQPRRGFGAPLPYATSALWPFLLMVALVVQSLTESRILIESGWLLLVLLAAKSRFDFELPSLDAEPQRVPWRQVPIPRDHAPALAAKRRP